jgi:hypothetical protein
MAYTPNAISGPSSSTSGNLPSFNNTTGNSVADSGVAIANVVVDSDLGTAALVDTGTSGATVPLLNTANEFSEIQTIYSASTAGMLNLKSGQSTSYLMGIRGYAKNSAAADFNYYNIWGEVVDGAAGSEDSRIGIHTSVAGTLPATPQFWFGAGLYAGAATGGDQGAGTFNATEYYKNGVALSLTLDDYDSGNQTITAGGALTLAHGLGVVPKIVQYRLQCLTTEDGWAVGDEIDPTTYQDNSGSGAIATGMGAWNDATNCYIRFGSYSATFNYFNKSTGAYAALTNANWALIVRAYA